MTDQAPKRRTTPAFKTVLLIGFAVAAVGLPVVLASFGKRAESFGMLGLAAYIVFMGIAFDLYDRVKRRKR